MPCNIQNNSQRELPELESMVTNFYPYAKKRLGFDKGVDLDFISDEENAALPLGKTAYYDPGSYKISVYVDGRHPKDILRSISHELVHHAQNCRGEFDNTMEVGKGYAQIDVHLRNMEFEAYSMGNGLIFRDWEDSIKVGDRIMNEWKIKRKKKIGFGEGTPPKGELYKKRSVYMENIDETIDENADCNQIKESYYKALDNYYKQGDVVRGEVDSAQAAWKSSNCQGTLSEKKEHPGECEDVHKGQTHKEWEDSEGAKSLDIEAEVEVSLKESFNKRNQLLNEQLMKKFIK